MVLTLNYSDARFEYFKTASRVFMNLVISELDSSATVVYICCIYVTGEEKIVARPGLEPWASRLPCKHSAN